MSIPVPGLLKSLIRRVLPKPAGPPVGELYPGFQVTAADTVVDFGCGAGPSCVMAGQAGAAVIGIDIDPAAIEQARLAMQKVPVRSFQAIVHGTLPLPLPDGIATVVLAREVIEHVDDPVGYLAELVRIGKNGARYLISVPDPASESLMRAVAPPSYFEKPGHINIFQREELDRLVRTAGLKIEKRTLAGFYWSMWWLLRWPTSTDYAPLSDKPAPAVLKHWDKTWRALQATPQGKQAIRALDNVIPKSQVIIARKVA
jgi:SAM-dependent methyltransferase